MMKVALYGYGEWGKKVIQQLKCDDIEVIGIIDNYLAEADNYTIWTSDAFIKKQVKVDYVIFAMMNFERQQSELIEQIINAGYKLLYVPRFYYFFEKKLKLGMDFIQNNCVDITGKILTEIECIIHDGCNLNCKGCAEFSPLYPKGECTNIDMFTSDMKRLKQIVPHILSIQLVGGEVLLNPDLDLYFKVTRELFPEAKIFILTNGLLIPKMDEKIIHSIKENGIFIYVTPYEPYTKMRNVIKLFAEKNGLYIHHNIGSSENGVRSRFMKMLFSSKVEDNSPCSCNLPAIYRGKYAVCGLAMVIDHFNKYFNTAYPEEGGYSLYDPLLDRESFIKRVNEKIPLCDYCALRANFRDKEELFYSWEAYGNVDPKKEDWIFEVKK